MKRTEEILVKNAHSINERNKKISILLDSFDSKDEIYVSLLMHDFNKVTLIAFTDETKYSKVIEFIENYL